MQDTCAMVGGYRIRYLDSDTPGHPVILLHGLGGYADKWIPAISGLSPGYRAIAPDVIGYGQSDKPLTDYTPEYFVTFLKNFIEALHLDRPHIVGASLSGQVAAQFAASYPHMISRLVLMSPAGIMKNSTPALDAYITAALYPRFDSVSHALQLMEGSDRRASPTLVESFIANMRRPNAKMVFMSSLLCFKNYDDITTILYRISCPTLLLWGYDDPIIPISYAAQFAAAIPNCTFTGIERCGHTPYVQYPDLVAKIVTSFLGKPLNQHT